MLQSWRSGLLPLALSVSRPRLGIFLVSPTRGDTALGVFGSMITKTLLPHACIFNRLSSNGSPNSTTEAPLVNQVIKKEEQSRTPFELLDDIFPLSSSCSSLTCPPVRMAFVYGWGQRVRFSSIVRIERDVSVPMSWAFPVGGLNFIQR